MTCDRLAEVQAYHDGELDDTRRVAVEAHVGQCEECAALLGELRALTNILSTAAFVEVPTRAVSRFHGAWYEARDQGMLRITSWMTAAAAALLVGVLLFRPGAPAESPVRPGAWETYAIAPPVEVQAEPGAELVLVAQWVADDLSVGTERR